MVETPHNALAYIFIKTNYRNALLSRGPYSCHRFCANSVRVIRSQHCNNSYTILYIIIVYTYSACENMWSGVGSAFTLGSCSDIYMLVYSLWIMKLLIWELLCIYGVIILHSKIYATNKINVQIFCHFNVIFTCVLTDLCNNAFLNFSVLNTIRYTIFFWQSILV